MGRRQRSTNRLRALCEWAAGWPVIRRFPACEPALLTFVVTASGMTLAGIGSAFWAVLLGLALCLILRGWR